MNHIYDILLNFQANLYDFYEWNIMDDIDHIKKIPIFKISNKCLNEVRKNQVIFSNEFLDCIQNKTEYFSDHGVKKIKYACLISDGKEILGLKIDNKIEYSRLLIDEEMDVLEIISRFNETNIPYKVDTPNNEIPLITRKQLESQKFLETQLHLLYQDDNVEKLKYIYYECFNEKEESKEAMISKLEMEKNKPDIFPKLSHFFELSR